MRLRSVLALIPSLVMLSACSSSEVLVGDPPDAYDTDAVFIDVATDHPTDSSTDAGPDSVADSHIPDSTTDSAHDSSPDSGLDSSADAAPDSPDAAPDSAQDSSVDSSKDSATADSATTDSSVDAPADSALVDSSVDASADSAIDSSPDASTPDASSFTSGAWPQSSYHFVASDFVVNADSDLLSAPFDLPSPSWVLLSSDGRYGPVDTSAANLFITIDGGKISNDSYIDWGKSKNPQQHCFNVIGAVFLGSGHHEAKLRVDYINGPFFVGAGANLSVMVHPADQLAVNSTLQDSAIFDYTTKGADPGIPTPHDPLVSSPISLSTPGDVVALASGRVYHAGSGANSYGDAMLGIYLDGLNPGNNRSTWAVNDIWTGAETQAPLFVHAFFPALPTGSHVVSFDASEFPWTGQEDTVVYRAGGGATLLVLRDALTVRGSAPISQAVDNAIDYIGIGTSENWPGVPPVGTDVELASATFEVPVGHSGVVMFMSKSRVQGDSADAGGTVSLRLLLDGSSVGSSGIQQLKTPDSVSQRTISASYLAAGSLALKPGSHTIKAIARADGSFKHLAMNKDLPLLWFD